MPDTKKLTWDDVGKRFYETGVDRGVLYPMDKSGAYEKGVAWNGLISATETSSGAEPTNLYANNVKYLSLMSAEEFKLTIKAYTYPDEFGECDGSAFVDKGLMLGQQPRKKFGFSYRSVIGNDTEGQNHGYIIHLVYGLQASPSERAYNTVNEQVEAMELSWECNSTPLPVEGYKPTSILKLDTTKLSPEALQKIEDMLYGTESKEPKLPLPDEIIQIVKSGGMG